MSAIPALLPHTLPLCLGILPFSPLVNLRGRQESGLAFMLPTYTFVAAMAIVIAVGMAKSVLSGGHPAPVVAPPALAGGDRGREPVDPARVLRQRLHGHDRRRGGVATACPSFADPTDRAWRSER